MINKDSIGNVTPDDIGKEVTMCLGPSNQVWQGKIVGMAKLDEYVFVRWGHRERDSLVMTYNLRWGHIEGWY